MSQKSTFVTFAEFSCSVPKTSLTPSHENSCMDFMLCPRVVRIANFHALSPKLLENSGTEQKKAKKSKKNRKIQSKTLSPCSNRLI